MGWAIQIRMWTTHHIIKHLLLPIFKYVDNELILRSLNKKYYEHYQEHNPLDRFSKFDKNNNIYAYIGIIRIIQ